MNQRIASRGVLGAIFLAVFATGCTTVKVVEEYDGRPLPRPNLVLVYDFAISPDQVRLDRGVSPMLEDAIKGAPRSQQEMQIGGQVANALTAHLVQDLRNMGYPAQRADVGYQPVGNTVAIQGQFVSVDEGNRTERVVIGLGLGRTDVRVMAQLYEDTEAGQTMLERLDASSKSGRKPGMAETMGVGGLTGNLVAAAAISAAGAVGSEAFGANVDADAARLAKKLAEEFQSFAQRQGWAPES